MNFLLPPYFYCFSFSCPNQYFTSDITVSLTNYCMKFWHEVLVFRPVLKLWATVRRLISLAVPSSFVWWIRKERPVRGQWPLYGRKQGQLLIGGYLLHWYILLIVSYTHTPWDNYMMSCLAENLLQNLLIEWYFFMEFTVLSCKKTFLPEFSIFISISSSVANERDKRGRLSLSFNTEDDIKINIKNSAKNVFLQLSIVNSIKKYHSINYFYHLCLRWLLKSHNLNHF